MVHCWIQSIFPVQYVHKLPIIENEKCIIIEGREPLNRKNTFYSLLSMQWSKHLIIKWYGDIIKLQWSSSTESFSWMLSIKDLILIKNLQQMQGTDENILKISYKGKFWNSKA